VTDPRSRATLLEIMHHPWMLKGYSGPPENSLPPREPLTVDGLDPVVINGMTGFEFGTAEIITAQLTKILESEDYEHAVKQALRDAPLVSPNPEKKKAFGFDFYKRRPSTSSKDTLTTPSAEVLPYTQSDPINAYNPLTSIYYLVREKRERDKRAQPAPPGSDIARLPIPPEAAHTSETSYEVRGEPASASARTRPRARTHGDDEVNDVMQKVSLASPPVSQAAPPKVEQPARKDLSVGSMFRRLSTRRHNPSRAEPPKAESSRALPPPTLSLQPPDQTPINLPRKSLSIRRQKEPIRALAQNSASQPGQSNMLTPPTSADGMNNKKKQPLGRSTSVSEADWRRKYSRARNSMEPPATSGSERSMAGRLDVADKPFAARAKSVGHAKRDSIRIRRSKRENTGDAETNEDSMGDDVAEIATSAGSGDAAVSATPSADFVKPVFLKGLFSVSTTSTKPPLEIRKDIIRVLDQLGVSYKEIRGGFTCVHRPSIDLKSVQEGPQQPEPTNMVSSTSHRRKLSFTSNAQTSGKHSSRRNRPETSYTNSDASNDSVNDGVLGGSLILQFEIYIVKVPLLALHGIQFKSVNKTNTWQYKSLASRILSELRL
jgi:hypothetical protein